MCGIYIAVSLLGMLIIFVGLDGYEQIGLDTDKPQKNKWKLLVNTLRHMANKNQLLIIPLTVWSGLEQAFAGADFTRVV